MSLVQRFTSVKKVLSSPSDLRSPALPPRVAQGGAGRAGSPWPEHRKCVPVRLVEKVDPHRHIAPDCGWRRVNPDENAHQPRALVQLHDHGNEGHGAAEPGDRVRELDAERVNASSPGRRTPPDVARSAGRTERTRIEKVAVTGLAEGQDQLMAVCRLPEGIGVRAGRYRWCEQRIIRLDHDYTRARIAVAALER